MFTPDHGFNQEYMQELNRALLIKLLRKEGICARTVLAKKSRLKQATVTNIINDFIDWGIVREVGFLVGNKGRRSIGIALKNDEFGVIGIQLARKYFSVGVFDLSGNPVDQSKQEIESAGTPKDTMKKISTEIRSFIEKHADRKMLAIGMAVPGPFSVKKGRIELMTGSSGWNDISIQDLLEEEFGLPVFLENDANCGALAQYWYNDEQYEKEVMVYIAAGAGIGAGIMNQGELVEGTLGMAGEIGHMSINFGGPRCACGNFGCLELYCSASAFVKEMNRVLKPAEDYTFAEAKELVKEGNPIAMEIYSNCCDKLGAGVVNVINAFNPAVVVIGDEMSHVSSKVMLERVKREVKIRVLPEVYENMIISMSVTKDSMLHGAAIVSLRDIFRDPKKYFSCE